MNLRVFTIPKPHWPGSKSSTRIALALKAAGIIAATFVVFYRELAFLFLEATQHEIVSYVLAVPFILVFLIYRKRKMLRTVMVEEEQVQNPRYLSLLWGFLLASIAILLYWYGAYTTTGLEYQMFALSLFTASMCLILFNSQTLRQLAFPITLLIFLAMGLFFSDHNRTVLVFQSVRLPIDWALFLTGTLILFVAYREVFRNRIFAHASECSQCDSSRRSVEEFCRQCGRILRPASARFGRKDLAKLFSVFCVAIVLSSIAFQGPFYVLAKGQSGAAINKSTGEYYSSQVFPSQSQYFLAFLYENLNYEVLTNQDLSLNYLYSPLNGSGKQILASLEVASAQSGLRNWETHVLSSSQGGRSRAAQIEVEDVMLASKSPTSSRFFAFEYTDIGQIQAVLYWNEMVNFMADSTIEQKYAQISLIVLPSSTSDLAAAKSALIMLATAIADYWQPITDYSKLTLLVIQTGPLLLAVASTGLAATLIYCRAENRRRKRSSQRAIEKLDKAEKNIVKAIQHAKQPATIGNIVRTLRENCLETVTKEELERKLAELEKTKIIRASTYGVDDEPLRIWKT